jgi:endonuclease YncB( thermonuclease family)
MLHKLIPLLLLFATHSIYGATLVGRVVGVADGDTITILDVADTKYKIRLQGIDAPEKSQPFGEKSKQSLHKLIHGKSVSIQFQKKDKYGRVVGKVLLNDMDVCLEQISYGMAWHYKQYELEQTQEERITYGKAEQIAQTAKLGLWSDKTPTPPWEFRKIKK